MQLEKFISGEWIQQFQYKSFFPTLVNQSWEWLDPTVNTLLEQASTALAELNTLSFMVPDVDLFIGMHIAKEANTSSRIEGTQTRMDEAIMSREQILPEKRDDWDEVQNYIKAINVAIKKLETLPLSNRLLKETHSILLSGVRGEHKTPGEFRLSQNWIGGSNLKDAVFIPPHQDKLSELMSDLEQFWHNESIEVPKLIRIAISHYQFETIHPFLDGNGRIGRLLITLYLVDKKLLDKPALYLSDFFERNRESYYDALSLVRTSNNMIHWIKFFLTAVKETATNSKNVFMEIMKLKVEIDQQFLTFGKRAKNAHKLLEHLYKNPVISVKKAEMLLSISNTAANKLVEEFENKKLLEEITGYGRNRVYLFKVYFDLFIIK